MYSGVIVQYSTWMYKMYRMYRGAPNLKKIKKLSYFAMLECSRLYCL